MVGSARTRPLSSVKADAEVDYEDLPDFCANPTCRHEFRRSSGPGRPQAYCREQCRRHAERDLRRLRARQVRFENVLAQVHADIAAHGKTGEDAASSPTRSLLAAEQALTQAAAVVRYASEGDPRLLDELRHLLEHVTPVIRPGQSSTLD